MRYYIYLFVFITGCIFLSCTTRPEVVATEKTEKHIPKNSEIPEIPEYLLGKGIIPSEDLASFLQYSNPMADADFVKELADLYVEEAALEGVNHDVAFAQMCLETGFLQYGNLVTPDMNNFCGLGAISAEQPGERFSEPRIGVRAQIQHLKGYATDTPLEQELVDPRYIWVNYGSAPTIKGLAGSWAADPDYAVKISGILERLYEYSFRKDIRSE
ncbi:MAG: glucosaminidase domain-containing protein [Treponema sp.]|jgi:hypothetical protein|nr:glucosaminidase domain-containing protein [Treponema sp.]